MRQDYDSAIHLFPDIEPFDSGFFERDNHPIYYEQTGNPAGKVILFFVGNYTKYGCSLSFLVVFCFSKRFSITLRGPTNFFLGGFTSDSALFSFGGDDGKSSDSVDGAGNALSSSKGYCSSSFLISLEFSLLSSSLSQT